jgi:hypothetical protein
LVCYCPKFNCLKSQFGFLSSLSKIDIFLKQEFFEKIRIQGSNLVIMLKIMAYGLNYHLKLQGSHAKIKIWLVKIPNNSSTRLSKNALIFGRNQKFAGSVDFLFFLVGY